MFFFLWFCFCDLLSASIHNKLQQRLDVLQRIAKHDNFRSNNCNNQKYVYISEYQYGNSGNNLIEFTHGLWIAKMINATLIVPVWMQAVLKPFSNAILNSTYCYTLDSTIPKHTENIEITSEDSFFLFKLFHDPEFKASLPPLNDKTIQDLSLHFLQVYASLWCCPEPSIVSAAEWLIDNYLNGNILYTSVHKRKLENGCGKILGDAVKSSDISVLDLPLNSKEWNGNLVRHHPLCEMTLEFVLDTMSMHGRNGSQIFVAFDGNGDISKYKEHHAIFSEKLHTHDAHKSAVLKYVDMFLAMHSNLFILNPRSTFSWQIYLIRVMLHLDSVPVIQHNDFFMQKVSAPPLLPTSVQQSVSPLLQPGEQYVHHSQHYRYKDHQRALWVSWLSVVKAFKDNIDLLNI